MHSEIGTYIMGRSARHRGREEFQAAHTVCVYPKAEGVWHILGSE